MKYDKSTRDLIREIFKIILAFAMVYGCFSVLLKMIPLEGFSDVIKTMVGVLVGCVATIYTYEFGSSRGSQTKDENKDLN
jgi:hypothetical protein